MPKRLYVIIGCDVDPDRESFVGKLPANTLTWRGMLEGIPRGKDRVRRLVDSQGKPPVFSWCIRVDHQVESLCGSYDYVLTKNRSFLTELEDAGDEISWHPHFWKYDQSIGQWYQEYWDVPFQVEMLKTAYAAFQKQFPGRAKTVRMGWSFHNNQTFATMEALGVQVDYGAIPGLKVLPKHDKVRSSNFYDSSLCEDEPFYPARTDYRRAAKNGEDAFNVLELPVFVSRSFFWGLGAAAQLTRKMKDPSQLLNGLRRPTHLINITGKPNWFAPLLKRAEKMLKSQDTLFFNTYLHADELIENNHPFYSLEYMETNIKGILDLGHRSGTEVRFVRALDVPALLSGASRR